MCATVSTKTLNAINHSDSDRPTSRQAHTNAQCLAQCPAPRWDSNLEGWARLGLGNLF